MEQKSQFEHQLDPELLEEIEEWEQQEHTGPEEYYFSNPDPYFKPAPLPPNHPKHNFWFDEDGHILREKSIRFLAAGVHFTERDWWHDLLRHRQL